MWTPAVVLRPVTTGRIRWQAAGVVAAAMPLAWQLPSPGAIVRMLVGTSRSGATGGVADAAMLAVAALAVWLLLAYVALVAGVAMAGRLPGTAGAAARVSLAVMAPVAMRNVVLTVVGASVVTGLAGCATTGPVAPDATGVSATAAAVPRSTATAEPFAVASQLRAERLIGIATLRISDRIAVEGSAVRSVEGAGAADASAAGAGPAGAGPAGARPGGGSTSGAGSTAGPGTGSTPSVDWPATTAGITGSATPPAATISPSSPAAPPAGPRAPDHPSAVRTAPSGTARPTPSAAPGVSVDWPGSAARGTSSADQSVVVLRGDSLWAIAVRSLPDGADDATVDRTWRAWYSANTAVIGDNPDSLLPGQILQPPTATSGTGTHR